MTIFLIVELILVLIFLLMFLRRPSLVWGVGLLTVTTAVLLDTFFRTFSRADLINEFGFLFYLIAGMLVGGMAVWTWGVLASVRGATAVQPTPVTPPMPTPTSGKGTAVIPPPLPELPDDTSAALDRQMLYDEIRQRFGREDILDLMFDLGLNESDVVTLDQNLNQLIVNIMDKAQANGQTADLTLAVERILTPISPDLLPRPGKIEVHSPRPILRYYLLANYDLTGLRQIAAHLGTDWEQLGGDNKKAKVRDFLLYLYRRNRIDELITLLRIGQEEEE
jgi:hypothetical protein